MTKQEAITAMKEGKKVTHRHFSDHEFIKMQGNFTVVTTEGYEVEDTEFWRYRMGKAFDKDWSIFKEK